MSVSSFIFIVFIKAGNSPLHMLQVGLSTYKVSFSGNSPISSNAFIKACPSACNNDCAWLILTGFVFQRGFHNQLFNVSVSYVKPRCRTLLNLHTATQQITAICRQIMKCYSHLQTYLKDSSGSIILQESFCIGVSKKLLPKFKRFVTKTPPGRIHKKIIV